MAELEGWMREGTLRAVLREMKLRRITTLVIALALVSVAAACGTTEISPDSSSGISVRFVEAARSKDVKTFKSLLSKKSLQRFACAGEVCGRAALLYVC